MVNVQRRELHRWCSCRSKAEIEDKSGEEIQEGRKRLKVSTYKIEAVVFEEESPEREIQTEDGRMVRVQGFKHLAIMVPGDGRMAGGATGGRAAGQASGCSSGSHTRYECEPAGVAQTPEKNSHPLP